MNTLQLDKKVSVPGFLGAFAYDELPEKPDGATMMFSLIINVDPSNLPGSHWIALVYKNSCFFFIDSYGRLFKDNTFPSGFSAKIKNYIGNSCYKTNTKMYQQFTSNTCGQYCVYFIEEMVKKSFEKVCNVFTDNLRKNDLYVTKYVEKL